MLHAFTLTYAMRGRVVVANAKPAVTLESELSLPNVGPRPEAAGLAPEVAARYRLTTGHGTPYVVLPANLDKLHSRGAVKVMMQIWSALPTLWIGSIPSKCAAVVQLATVRNGRTQVLAMLLTMHPAYALFTQIGGRRATAAAFFGLWHY